MGITCCVEGELVRVRGPKEAAAVGNMIVNRKPEVFAWLSATEWNQDEAIRLMTWVDDAVWSSATVKGTHPDLVPIVTKIMVADTAGHLGQLRTWCVAARALVVKLDQEGDGDG